jgi:hypothetical protein
MMHGLSHDSRYSRLNSDLFSQLSLDLLAYLLMNLINQASFFSLILVFSSYVLWPLGHTSLIVSLKILRSFLLFFSMTRPDVVLNANEWGCLILVLQFRLTPDLLKLAFQRLASYYLMVEGLGDGDLDGLLVIEDGWWIWTEPVIHHETVQGVVVWDHQRV